MKWENYSSLATGREIRIAIARDKALSSDNYNAEAHRNAKLNATHWSISEFTRIDSRAGLVARCLLFGKDEKGGDAPNVTTPLSLSMRVKIQVMSRQGCHLDADGEPINSNQKDLDECTAHDEQPVAGDVVIVRRGMKTKDSQEKNYTGSRRTRDVMAGIPIHYQQSYTVDDDGCILVTVEDAFTLLGRAGHRIVQPEFKPKLSGLNIDDKRKERRITNWLYKEVNSEFESDKGKQKRKKETNERDKMAAEIKRLKAELKKEKNKSEDKAGIDKELVETDKKND